MARIRTIKPEFWVSEQVVDCSPSARLLFVGMWNFCDDYGAHPASARTLKMEVFPGDDITTAAVKELVDELLKVGLLEEYQAEGKRFWLVTGWHHQKVDKPTQKYPFPPNDSRDVDERSTNATPDAELPFDEGSPSARRALTPGRESKGKESNTPPTPSRGPDASWSSDENLRKRFDRWFDRYPKHRRGAREPTWKTYRSIAKRRKSMCDELDSALDRYLQAGYGSSKFAKGAKAWLNGEQWTVEEFARPSDATGPPEPPAVAMTEDEQLVHRAKLRAATDQRMDELRQLIELADADRMAEAVELAKKILSEHEQ